MYIKLASIRSRIGENMRIFKSVDEKLKEIGFNKICEDKGMSYGQYMAEQYKKEVMIR